MSTSSPDLETLKSQVASLTARLAELETREHLRDLVNEYARACDAADVEAVKRILVPGANMRAAWFPAPGVISGRDTIATGIGSAKTFGHVMHNIGNVIIEVHGGQEGSAQEEEGGKGRGGGRGGASAVGFAYLSFYATPDARAVGEIYAFGGQYRFDFVRGRLPGDGEGEREWRIADIRIERYWEQGKDTRGAFAQGFEKL